MLGAARPESAVTYSDASVSGGADAVSVEEPPRANLKGGLANPKAGLMRLEVLSRRLMSPRVLFEAVWLESPASQSGLAQPFWGGFGTLTALKALGRGPGRPSWRLLERPTCSASKKARSTARANGSRFGVLI